MRVLLLSAFFLFACASPAPEVEIIQGPPEAVEILCPDGIVVCDVTTDDCWCQESLTPKVEPNPPKSERQRKDRRRPFEYINM